MSCGRNLRQSRKSTSAFWPAENRNFIFITPYMPRRSKSKMCISVFIHTHTHAHSLFHMRTNKVLSVAGSHVMYFQLWLRSTQRHSQGWELHLCISDVRQEALPWHHSSILWLQHGHESFASFYITWLLCFTFVNIIFLFLLFCIFKLKT